jgi:ATP-dependent Zn protease
MFTLNNYNDLKILDGYIKGLFKFYLQVSYKILFIFEGLEKFKKVEFNNNEGFKYEVYLTFANVMRKYVKKFHKRNLQDGNKFYFIFSITGVFANDYIFHNLLYHKLRINFIDETTCNQILNMIFGINDLAEYCKNFIFEDFIHIYKNKTAILDPKSYLSKYIPINLFDEKIIKLENDFSSIGGLKEVKDEISDTILLPIQCEKMFDNLPIKLSSGILLIGPSGCGKTMIASALSKEFKINFYSIKGPEILNKYIGASEAAIREIFENAKKTVPCIVFFDEFDSIAPKRGTGSSGVTDRIVNQLLTYLDGIESREGIFVIGASSRPDLIDPAILRPGRIDKVILCDFPNEIERFDILRLYYNKAHKGLSNLSNDIEKALKDIAQKSEFFTGADLQSIIYNAFLLAVKMNIANGVNESPLISEENLHDAFEGFKPSLNKNDIVFQKEIRKKFIGRVENLIDQEIRYSSDLKTTLY